MLARDDTSSAVPGRRARTRRGSARSHAVLRRGGCVLLGLVGLECGLRFGGASALGVRGLPPFVEHDDALGWRNRPDVNVEHEQHGRAVDVTIDADGFRTFRGADASARGGVLVVGDSMAFGWGVDDDDALGARLAARLDGVAVRTAAVIGYGTDQERLMLRRVAPRVRPDHVVLVFCANDALECTLGSAYGRAKPRFELGPDGGLTLVPPRRTLGHLADRSVTWRVARRLVDHGTSVALARDGACEWALVRALLLAIVRDLDGVPLTVVSHEDAIAALARTTDGMEHVHLDHVLRPLGERGFLPGDMHWSPEGHAAVAAAVAQRLGAR